MLCQKCSTFTLCEHIDECIVVWIEVLMEQKPLLRGKRMDTIRHAVGCVDRILEGAYAKRTAHTNSIKIQ
ncbi:hypothetical protein SDC9_206459 [bioreactor metagenome]|uniref:Uncharacterized protein n=1 Tax=bioreactor metagenome TaxID=1076179 RepID=A0A645J5M0_9ZZZZ